jgi:hypothetical protein
VDLLSTCNKFPHSHGGPPLCLFGAGRCRCMLKVVTSPGCLNSFSFSLCLSLSSNQQAEFNIGATPLRMGGIPLLDQQTFRGPRLADEVESKHNVQWMRCRAERNAALRVILEPRGVQPVYSARVEQAIARASSNVMPGRVSFISYTKPVVSSRRRRTNTDDRR